MRALALLLVVAAALTGCAEAVQQPVAGEAARVEAPSVAVPTPDGPVILANFRGAPVVLQFAEADDIDAWAALADASVDLEASGAVVLAVEVDGSGDETAQAFGYDGHPLVLVVDGEGVLRGSADPVSGDVVYALAAPVLAESDLAQTVAWEGTDTLEGIAYAGGVVVDLGADPDAFPNALRITLDALSADALPADLGTPLAFIGTGAEDAARRTVEWGYVSVYVASATGDLREIETERPPLDEWRPRRGGVRG